MRGLLIALSLLLSSSLAGPANASFVDYSAKRITCKIVYYGAMNAPLHDNLAYVYGQTNAEAKQQAAEEAASPGISRKKSTIAREAKDSFYEFLPLTLGEIRGYKTQFHLYTVPTKADYNASRLLVLKGTDAVVFVASNDSAELNATIASWQELKRNLAELGYAPGALPIVVQLDHREHTNAIPVAKLSEALGITTEPTYEAVAPTGVGVFETLKATAKLVLSALKKE